MIEDILISEEKIEIGSFQDLEIYKLSLRLAAKVFKMTEEFPKLEEQGLVPQMRNASRNIAVNIANGWGKRKRETLFRRHLRDSMGNSNEILVYLDTALSCEYLTKETHEVISDSYINLGKRLNQMHANIRTFEQMHSDWRATF